MVDVLRGFALFGILLVNMSLFEGPGSLPGFVPDEHPVDRAASLAILAFAQAKFFARFSFLFGLGFSIQLLIAERRGGRFAPLFLRRLLVLLVFGLTLGGPLLSLGYAAAVALLSQNPSWAQRLAPLAATGRMALTNYLLQSIVCTTLFYSYGGALFGRVGAAGGLLVTVALYALQVPFSVWWLRRFPYGPMEWLWRTATYGRPPSRYRSSPSEL
ncbi:MAG TPA: DUF418 domain-containing protein [Chloroflexota bacterium]|nr:DUF418 domain-containing protein [Chloroflexota bacterium]